MSVVGFEVTGSTATITLDSPSNRNAISPALLEGISDGLSRASADDAVRSIVLTHTGNVFCAGADLKEASRATDGSANRPTPAEAANAVIREILTCDKPVIAAVHGHVRAGGMGFVAACDSVVAGPRASFGLSEVRIGVVAAMIAPIVLARIDDRTAADWLLRARAVTPTEALAAGFITTVVAEESTSDQAGGTVDGAVEEILADLRMGAPQALAATKALANRSVLARMDAEEDEMIDLSARFFAGSDAQAGMDAFLNKSQPPWVIDR
jgi:enoyl-CoA hydratase